MNYSIKRTTEPASEPITLTEAKNHLRIATADDADDDKITLLIKAARQQVERDLRASLMQQTWTLKRDDFGLEIDLPFGPVQSVTSVKYIDGTGAQQTASNSLYTLDSFNNPAVVRLDWDDTWPTHRGDARGIEIVYVAGYSSASTVPASIKAAILFQLEMMFDGVNPSLEHAYERLIATSLEGSYP